MDNARKMKMFDPAEHLVKEVGHPLVVQVHVDHLLRHPTAQQVYHHTLALPPFRHRLPWITVKIGSKRMFCLICGP